MKLIAALIVTFPMLAQTARSAPHTVTAVRHYRTGEITRVAIEVSGEFNFVTERLHNPERVYYDITNASRASTAATPTSNRSKSGC